MLLLLCAVLLGTTVAQNSILNNYKVSENPGYRLTGEAVPLSYEITIEPNFETFTFRGFVHIKASIVKDTNSVLIHENEIKTGSITMDRDGSPLNVNAIERDGERNFLQISVEEQLLIGDTVDIYIDYEGYLNQNNTGFYRAKYVDSDGNDSLFALTQMAPTFARQVFPCFDEPALKANFTLNLIRQAQYNSASNMNLLKTSELGANRYMDTFETSVKMSTYLVAFVVSKFDKISKDNHSLYGTPEALSNGYGDYALEHSQKVITAMEEFTNIPYALNKMGQVAVPFFYFYFGAMENWGLVLYQDYILFYEENVIGTKQTTLSLMSHEYGHQWFGNLVSPLWWEYVWLNEGFGRYCEYYISDILDPSLRMNDQFLPGVHQYAMIYDATERTRPMTFYAENPDDILELFDIIAYDKAASVIRMTEHYLSNPIFVNGLNKYLNKMAFSSATATDLFDSFQDAVDEIGAGWIGGLSIHDVFTTWHLQSGYPYVNVTRDYEHGEAHFVQSRFYLNQHHKATDEIWFIPINHASASDPYFESTTPTYWLLEKSGSRQLYEDSWIIINKKATGYYRVNYDKTNWMRLATQLKENHTIIHLLNRAQLIDDSFSLAKAGIIDMIIPITLAEYIINETDYIPLTIFYYHILNLDKILETSDISEKFKERVISLLQLTYESLSFDKDITEHTMILNREKIHNLMCKLGYEKCTSGMEQRLMKLLSVGGKIHPDLQSSVYCGGMVNNNNLELKWEKMYQRYTEAEYGEKTRIIEGLACSNDKTILKRILLTAAGMYKNHKFVAGDVINAFKAVSSRSNLGAVTTLEFLIDNYQKLNLTRIEKSTILSDISKGLYAENHKQMLNKLAGYEKDANMDKAIKYAISDVDINMQILNLFLPQLTTYLSK